MKGSDKMDKHTYMVRLREGAQLFALATARKVPSYLKVVDVLPKGRCKLQNVKTGVHLRTHVNVSQLRAYRRQKSTPKFTPTDSLSEFGNSSSASSFPYRKFRKRHRRLIIGSSDSPLSLSSLSPPNSPLWFNSPSFDIASSPISAV